MKKITAFVAAAIMTIGLVSAASAEIKVTGDAYVGLYNKYLFRGFDLSGNQGVVQGGVDLTYKDFTLSYWSNFQTHAAPGYTRSKITETDITLNYTFSPTQLLTMNVGNTYYSLDSFKDTNELYLKTTLNTLLSPTLSIYWDWDEARTQDMTGLFYTLSVGHTFNPVKNVAWNLGALVSYNQENYSVGDFNNLHNYELSTSIDYSLTDNIKISPSYTYSNAFNRSRSHINDESLFGIKAAFNF